MGEIERNWMMPLAAAVLLLSAAITAPAQSALIGSLSGKLTDLNSAPLAGATVVVRNQATGAETRTITANDGRYRFEALETGDYALEADSPQQGHGLLQGIHISAGHLARVQAAMQLDLAPPATIRTVFLKNQKPPQPDAHPLTPSLAANTPTPATIREPIPVHTQLLSPALQPEIPQNRALIAALPTAELPLLNAILVSVAPIAAIYPGMAKCIAIADGLRTAMRASLPHSNSIR